MPASFSAKVKEELSRVDVSARHCRIAQTASMTAMNGRVCADGENAQELLTFKTENVTVARKYFTLLKKTFNIEGSVSIRHETGPGHSRVYELTAGDEEAVHRVLSACRLEQGDCGRLALRDELIIQRDCCRRAFLRGAFLTSGSISDPVRSYHFEIVCGSQEMAAMLQDIIRTYDVPARIIVRKGHYVVYVKDGSQVVDLLNVMGAYKALMDMENVRIVKEMRNQVNRSVNCETANIGKTAAAAVRQINDIEYIMNSSAFSGLPEPLKETAGLRLKFPEATLAELGKMLDPPVGKSGVNHRLNRISRYAQELRERSAV